MADKVYLRGKKLKQRSQSFLLADWLTVASIIVWGAAMLKSWFTQELRLLVHPRYFWVVLVTGIFLLFVGAFKAWMLLQKPSKPNAQHFSLLPPVLTSGLFFLAAILALLVSPQPLTSQAAMQQGLSDTLISTRINPQSFRASLAEERSLFDWVKTLAVYPEPDSYTGQEVKVQGFVVHPDKFPDEYFILTRFVIGHCALDAYPVGLPVQLTESRQAYSPDTWLEVEGKMITTELEGNLIA